MFQIYCLSVNCGPKSSNIIILLSQNKLEGKKNQSDSFVTIYKLFSYYIETYDFSREIDILAQIYYKDSNRLKNLRLLIIDSLNDKHLIEKLQKILNEL